MFPTITAKTSIQTPPEWAVLERELIDKINDMAVRDQHFGYLKENPSILRMDTTYRSLMSQAAQVVRRSWKAMKSVI